MLAILAPGTGCAASDSDRTGRAGADAGLDASEGHDAAAFDAGGEPDAGNGRDGGEDAGIEGDTLIELVNTGADPLFLEGSYNQDCGPPYFELRDADSGQALVDRLPFLTCDCDGCGSPGCQGMADAGPAYLRIPAGGTAQVTWAGGHYELAGGCQRGCLESHPVGDGPFELTARYRRESIDCPNGGIASEAEISGPPGDGTLLICEPGLVRCFDDTTLLDRVVEVTFRRSDGPVRVELP